MKDTFEAGMKVRREVLGNKHVDSAEGKKDSFTEEFQEMITRYAWGEIWTRPGLERKTRSCITLAMMIALNREDEFKLHIKAGLNNGLSKDEIKEVILQTAIYAGVPAANSAYHWAQEVFANEHL
ncbi:MAG: 4-carboxymuconolactone decarboxylase [Rhodospirillales bacterium]|jgi:4-carboxymuconolactone decarboxylase|nr:4-carboxymuconolactone decarboxylase [Rhodospirillales bacterium]MDC0989433.1 4-carboxymuconolactone decarboxylase [Rhodospirillales bacterium]